MSQKAIFPGTFDPITNGHVDLVQRAATRFASVIVSVAGSGSKSPCFTLEERIDLACDALADCKNVQVKGFEGLLVHFARNEQAGVILRGLRTMSDFEYEFQLANMNRRLAPDVETMFLTKALLPFRHRWCVKLPVSAVMSEPSYHRSSSVRCARV